MEAAQAEAFVHAVAADWRQAPLTGTERALCEMAARLTRHQRDMGPQDVAALRAHGLDDRAIHDAVQVVGYFNYITRVADALGVEGEGHIPAWGRGG